jgi:hypothetical protein
MTVAAQCLLLTMTSQPFKARITPITKSTNRMEQYEVVIIRLTKTSLGAMKLEVHHKTLTEFISHFLDPFLYGPFQYYSPV